MQHRKFVRAITAIAIAASSLVAFASPASAADGLVVREVDTSNHPTVELTALRPSVATERDTVKVLEDGKPVNAQVRTAEAAGVPIGIALVIDTSSPMTNGDAINKAKRAAEAMVRAKSANEQMAIIAVSSTPRMVSNFTNDAAVLLGSIEGLQTSGDPALWDGINMASEMLGNLPELQPNIIVISGSADATSKATPALVKSSLRTSNSMLFPIAVTRVGAVNAGELQQLAATTGGRYIETADPANLQQILAGLQRSLREQAVVTYTTTGEPRAMDVTLSIGSASTVTPVSPGTVAKGTGVVPEKVEREVSLGILDGKYGIFVLAAAVFIAIGLLLYGIFEIFNSRSNTLSSRLSPYSDVPADERDVSKLADSEIIKKAVAHTARIAQERGFLETVQRRLEQADLPLRPAEAMFFTAVSAVIAMILGAFLAGLVGLALAGLLFAYMPIMITGMRAKRRRRKFTGQLPDMLQLLAGSMRAGYSLPQAMDAVAKQADAPMGSELQRAMNEARLGRPVEEALQDVADRMQSNDFEWAVMAIRIQREVGGNLAELLMTVCDTMVERERLRREVRGLTAEGRLSGYVLVALPPGIGALVSLINPTYMQPMLGTTLGQAALVGAAILMGIGYWLMMKLIEVEA